MNIYDKFKSTDTKSLRYKHFAIAIKKLDESDDALGALLRVHLISESLIEELIRIVFDEKSNSILSIGLTYKQKLELISGVKLDKGKSLLPDFIIGSLRNLNSLRNKIVHNLNTNISNDDIEKLFVNIEFLPNNMKNREVHENLRDFAFVILPSILPIYDEV